MKINNEHHKLIHQIGIILNICWIIDSLENPIEIICQSDANCSIHNPKNSTPGRNKKISWTNQIKEDILNSSIS